MRKHYSIHAKISKAASAIVLFLCLGVTSTVHAQKILVVNDNDNILANTDSLKYALDNSIYSGYHYWNIFDSSGVGPTAAFMDTFDLVIWYASTDGVGLQLWNGTGTAGNADVVDYANTGKPLWIIGLDILFQMYGGAPDVFTTGEFPKDIMGLASYDAQAYQDDGNLGCPEADRVSTASSLFPNTIKWAFATLWNVDGCTPDAGTLSLYEMGPSTYSLYQDKCMFHNKHTGISVMSTFFDPALIDSFHNRVNFMEKGITYLLSGTTGVKNSGFSGDVTISPNPATETFTLEINAGKNSTVSVELFNVLGSKVSQQKAELVAGKNLIKQTVTNLIPGMYLVKVTGSDGSKVYLGRLNKL